MLKHNILHHRLYFIHQTSNQQLFEEYMKINLKQLFCLMLTESINQGGYDPENYVKLNE